MWLCKCVNGLWMTYLKIVGIFHWPWVPHGQSTCAAYSHECNSLPSPFPCLHVLLYEPSPTFTPPNPTSSDDAKMKAVPTFAALRQFRVAEQVTCHNSGKSLWLDLQANSWHGMVEWQRLRLTLSTQQQQNRSSVGIRGGCTQGPESCKSQVSSLLKLFKAAITHVHTKSPAQRAVASGNKWIGQWWRASRTYTCVFVSTLRKPSGSLWTSTCQQLDASRGWQF